MACTLSLCRGLEFLLLRETMHNSGVSDNTVLGRKITPEYWNRLYRHIRIHAPSFPIAAMFDERKAAKLSKEVACSKRMQDCVLGFIREELHLPIRLPGELLEDGNFMFSLGAVYTHRFFRLAAFFGRFWGTDDHEPAIRVICQKAWFLYLISSGKLLVSEDAFKEQKTLHELGVFNFIIKDYQTFNGILCHAAPRLKTSARDDVDYLTNTKRMRTMQQ